MKFPGRLHSWSGWSAPALQALLLQIGASAPTCMVAFFWHHLTSAQMSLGQATLVQGLIAALLTACCRLARWWILIQLLFPVALLITVALQLPPFLFLIAFLVLLFFYWSTFRTQVPFYPSGLAVWNAVLTLLPSGQALNVIDIGSGMGGLALHLATHRPAAQITGIELAPLPWLISVVRSRYTSNMARFIRGNYEAVDLAHFDVVFAYLSPAAMPKLWQKAQQEMRPGALLLSYEFLIPNQVPDLTVLPRPHGPVLYGWRR